MTLNSFNIRTYGILINQDREILISDEIYQGKRFSKFPGGGVELGESLPEALKREFIEECELKIDSLELLYVTESMVNSAFDDSQVIGVYYQVFTDKELMIPVKSTAFDFSEGSVQSFRWVPLQHFSPEELTFAMDQEAWRVVREKLFL